jgi:hypothetical protein
MKTVSKYMPQIKAVFQSGRHGDLVILPTDLIPEAAGPIDSKVLKLGEATGHKHQFVSDAQVCVRREDPKSDTVQFVEIVSPAPLSHEEHNEIVFDVGKKIVLSQHEYNPYSEAMEKVQD